jgi:hypothetical protein
MAKRRTRAPITPGAFHVSGIPWDSLYPVRRELRWERGQVSGDPQLVVAARERTAALEGQTLRPPEGPVTQHDHLSHPKSALIVLSDLFIPGTVDYAPQRPAIPGGAVG